MTKTDPATDLVADRIGRHRLRPSGRDSAAAGSVPQAGHEHHRHVILIAAAVLMLYPVIWMVVSSLRPNDVIFREPGLVLDSFEISNYVDGWNALTYPFNTTC